MTSRRVPSATTGGRGGNRVHRLAHRGLTALVLAGVLTGCATKADVRDIREDVARVEERQDSVYRLLQMQNRQILDSLTVTTERLLNVRGELANQLTQLQDQLVQVGELTSQVQIRLNQLDQELAATLREIRASGGSPPGGATTGGDDDSTFSMAGEFYAIGLEQIERNAAGTARRAFEMVVDSFPDHELAAEAQRQIGETYAMEGLYDEALQAFERVVQRYQDSDAAPRALYRAGVIAQDRGREQRAREYFRRVIEAYPDSDARRLAEEALRRL